MPQNREQIIDELKAILDKDVLEIKEQVDQLKNRFYKETEDAENADEEKQVELEKQFKELLAQYKKRKAEVAAQTEKELQDNLARKNDILAQMKEIVEAGEAGLENDEWRAASERMKNLQAEWKTIGAVPPTDAQTVRKTYQRFQEQYYDLVKINIELRDLDFKKNLELKTKLCEAAERLMNNENIIEASRALQQLHEEWAEIGPVARELREEIWERFKTASTAINKKHQAYFDALHAKEQDNLARKQELVARMQNLVDQTATQAKEQGSKIWEEATKQVLEIQTEWRTIGFAPKKFNQSIYEQYRDLCDAFFKAKNAYFKELREQYKLRAEQRKAREEQRKLRAEQRAEQKAAKSDDQLRRIREKLKQEIQTAENNILFFTAKSKTANKLVDSMQEKINQLKKQLDDINSRLDQ
jgi:hypothetical protein